MNNSGSLNKRKQRPLEPLDNNKSLATQFKTGAALSRAITKDRASIQNEFQKIDAGKGELEALKNMKAQRAPVRTQDEQASIHNKAELKAQGHQGSVVMSLIGKEMIENQRDSRRQRHINRMKESTKFIDQFYDNFNERNQDIKQRSADFILRSDESIANVMCGLTDELLLANEIAYVNGIWEKVGKQREMRNNNSSNLADNFLQLKKFQQKGSGSFLNKLREDLIDIAFLLEEPVDDLLTDIRQADIERYEQEHEDNDEFYSGVIDQDKHKFATHYAFWKDSVKRFHKLKQDDAISKFLGRMNSSEFVNPSSRIAIFEEMREEQMSLYNRRSDLLMQLDSMRPTSLDKAFVQDIADKLTNFNEESSTVFDMLVDNLAKDMENTNEDIDIAEADLLDFLQKNDAELEEGQTLEQIMEDQVKPTSERRKVESKALITNSVKYMEDTEYQMGEITLNIIKFYNSFATKLDSNKEGLKSAQINFTVQLAKCGDHHEEITDGQEEDLSKRVGEMKQAIHHVQLNEKLQDCFDILDQIQGTFRLYSTEYIKLVAAHPQTMEKQYNNFEADVCSLFDLYDASRREEIADKMKTETSNKQQALEDEAYKKWEKEQKRILAKTLAGQDPKIAAKGGKDAKPTPKGKPDPKQAERPALDVPQLEVPSMGEFTSEGGNKYVRQRPIEEIADNLMKPSEEDKTVSSDEEEVPEVEASPKNAPAPEVKETKKVDPKAKKGEIVIDEELEEKPAEVIVDKFEANDYMEKVEMLPPQDPDGTQTIHENLIVSKDRIVDIIEQGLLKTLVWLMAEKENNQIKVSAEGKDLQDKSVEELDENLRKQWPRKGRLEVEVFQERKSQVTTHNRKYERQVRTCLEKQYSLDDQWVFCLENVDESFLAFSSKHAKIQESLAAGKNLAELQGMSRREMDANQTFEEDCREAKDLMHDLGEFQIELLIKQNADMLKSCTLFQKGGNYSEEEIAWYRGQMTEIDNFLLEIKEKRLTVMGDYAEKMDELLKDPSIGFKTAYLNSIHELAAKEGLGKTFGQPRRLSQTAMRAEQAKCEQAQKGVEQLVDQLNDLCQKAFEFEKVEDFDTEKKSLSLQIRMLLVQLNRCIQHYGTHLGGFKGESKVLERMTYFEDQEAITQTEIEKEKDDVTMEDELQVLGAIGFNNPKDPYIKFHDAISKVDQMCKDLCAKLYQGENVKFLTGPDKIPEYLYVFIDHMKKQGEEFKISMCRQLRMSTERLEKLLASVPHSVFHYLQAKYTAQIEVKVDMVNNKFDDLKFEDELRKTENQRQLRPNLANPANKDLSLTLDNEEKDRQSNLNELIDDTQMDLLDIEQGKSWEYQTAMLNNIRCLVAIFDSTIYKADFIMLPGDEVVEKKHMNIKFLTAMDGNQDVSKQKTRKFPGLGKPVFKIKFTKLFPDQYGNGTDAEESDFSSVRASQESLGQSKPAATAGKGLKGGLMAGLASMVTQKRGGHEIIDEIEVQNTAHHKAIVRSRDTHYKKFKSRFEISIQDIMAKYEELRKDETRFGSYWEDNMKEITIKHI